MWPHHQKLFESKLQTSITFEVVLIINHNFKIVFECTYFSNMQIIETVCQV